MKHYEVVIVGSGLGGLECGYILSKLGYNVCVLEKNPQLGGCLQTFKRNKVEFDTGFHFVGGLEEGQFLHKLFRYFDLIELPWHKLDEDGYAEVILEDKSYFLPTGYERFADKLSSYFPHQRKQLENYTTFLKSVGDNIGRSFNGWGEGEASVNALLQQSAWQYLQKTIDDPLLRNVLSGASMTMELSAEKLPLYIFAQINSSFVQSAWRLNGGGSLIADKLSEGIRRMGGTVMTRANVTRLVEEDGKIAFVEIENGAERISGDYVISNLHPALTLSLIPESKYIRKIYRKRVSDLPNTSGMFTTHLQLKEGAVPYFNRNIFLYKNQNVWYNAYTPGEKVSSALVSSYIPKENSGYCRHLDILTPMQWEEVSKWADTQVGRRGEEYLAFKEQKAEECIDLVCERMPELKGNIEKVYTSTPLTYRDYTGTWQGSAYGIRKDCNEILMTLLTPQTPVPNLLLTGQNLNLHGILGVSMTSVFTCAKIVGMEKLMNELSI